MPIATYIAVALDCPDPRALAGFYAAILGGEIDGDDEWINLTLPSGETVSFQPSPGYQAPVWPSEDGSQQAHLDLRVPDVDAAEKEVLALGARVLDAGSPERNWRVYADPVGHPFCLCGPRG